MRVNVLMFSFLREHVGLDALPLDLDDGATGDDALDALEAQYPILAEYRPSVRLAVNEAYVPNDQPLHEGDELALIPPVSGG